MFVYVLFTVYICVCIPHASIICRCTIAEWGMHETVRRHICIHDIRIYIFVYTYVLLSMHTYMYSSVLLGVSRHFVCVSDITHIGESGEQLMNGGGGY